MKLHLDGIGPVVFDRSCKAKKINITIKSPDKVRVAIPVGVSVETAKQFALSKTGWIKKNLSKISHRIRVDNFNIDKSSAKKYLVDRLNYFSELYNFNYNRVFIRNQRTRWGSCSDKNNINLNIKLMGLPNRLIDYVILHELVHTKIKNHSSDFWGLLGQYVKDVKEANKMLKRYSCS